MTFWTLSVVETRRPVSPEISGFRLMRTSFSRTIASSPEKRNGIVVP